MDSLSERKTRIKKAIEAHAFVDTTQAQIVSRGGKQTKKEGWLFDIRNILLEANILEDIAAVFWETFAADRPLQVGGMETAGIPIVAGIVAHAEKYAHEKDASGFFVRKSRKKDGLMKIIEGQIKEGRKIVLVDDLINSGKSILKQIEVLRDEGYKVDAVWTLIRFRNEETYEHLRARGIKVVSLFSLDDFRETLGTKILESVKEETRDESEPAPWEVIWRFSSEQPSYFYVVPKSDPALDDSHVFFGSDSGTFRALNQEDGSVVWSYKVGSHPKGKGIFSSPALWRDTVIFGAYDGNVYGLDTTTGKKKWVYSDADWVGSSPTVAADLETVFIGLEFGLWRKRGGIAALNIRDGKKIWEYRMPCYTHSTPLYIHKHRQVVIGSNDGAAYLFDAKSGNLVWRFATDEISERELQTGFSEHDVKESFAYDATNDVLLFGRMDGAFFSIDRKSGEMKNRFKAEFGIYSTPLVYKDTVIFTSLDKNVYCLDIRTFEERWRWNAGARVFSSPVIIDDVLYVGANTGRLTTLDPRSGTPKNYFVVSERITNKVAYNPKSKRFFLPTFANEIYCLKRSEN